jgi:hypothetical protein
LKLNRDESGKVVDLNWHVREAKRQNSFRVLQVSLLLDLKASLRANQTSDDPENTPRKRIEQFRDQFLLTN